MSRSSKKYESCFFRFLVSTTSYTSFNKILIFVSNCFLLDLVTLETLVLNTVKISQESSSFAFSNAEHKHAILLDLWRL